MRPLNFLLIFIVCISLVLFSLQNTQLATIQLIEDIQFEAPLAIELIGAAGIGAVFAWLFGLLSQVQRIVGTRQNIRQIRLQEKRIQELEKDLQQIHQQGQRIKELEGDVETIHAEEKNNNSKPVVEAEPTETEASPADSEQLTVTSDQ